MENAFSGVGDISHCVALITIGLSTVYDRRAEMYGGFYLQPATTCKFPQNIV